jgi:hypothetical protein
MDPSETSSQDTECRFPIILKNQGSTNGRHLYDVEGNLLIDASGRPYNIYSASFKEAIDTKKIRCIHKITPGYRYFIVSDWQYDLFKFERRYGSLTFNQAYYIYEDEDIDKRPRKDHFVVWDANLPSSYRHASKLPVRQ